MTVDDNPNVMLALKIILEENGSRVDSSNDPISALTKFEAGLYDLSIIDIRIPQMEGYELYYNMRKIDDKFKVVFLSATASIPQRLRKSSQ